MRKVEYGKSCIEHEKIIPTNNPISLISLIGLIGRKKNFSKIWFIL